MVEGGISTCRTKQNKHYCYYINIIITMEGYSMIYYHKWLGNRHHVSRNSTWIRKCHVQFRTWQHYKLPVRRQNKLRAKGTIKYWFIWSIYFLDKTVKSIVNKFRCTEKWNNKSLNPGTAPRSGCRSHYENKNRKTVQKCGYMGLYYGELRHRTLPETPSTYSFRR